jgi:hypothetical protein
MFFLLSSLRPFELAQGLQEDLSCGAAKDAA